MSRRQPQPPCGVRPTDPGYFAGCPPANKGRKFPPEVLTEVEVQNLIRAASNRAPTGIRNRALIAALYRGGLRLGEALDLSPKDVDLEAGTITVLHGKGDKSRIVGVDAGASAILARWVERRDALGIGPRCPLFSTLAGESLKPSYVRGMLRRLAKRAGIEKRVHPHGLRHARASELMMRGVPVPIIQRVLGHASLTTTQIYLDHIAPAEVIEVMKEGNWAP
jgi:site-specific recombinase XerD